MPLPDMRSSSSGPQHALELLLSRECTIVDICHALSIYLGRLSVLYGTVQVHEDWLVDPTDVTLGKLCTLFTCFASKCMSEPPSATFVCLTITLARLLEIQFRILERSSGEKEMQAVVATCARLKECLVASSRQLAELLVVTDALNELIVSSCISVSGQMGLIAEAESISSVRNLLLPQRLGSLLSALMLPPADMGSVTSLLNKLGTWVQEETQQLLLIAKKMLLETSEDCSVSMRELQTAPVRCCRHAFGRCTRRFPTEDQRRFAL